MAKDYKFWDRLARRYARSPIKDEAAYRKKLDITREYLTPDMQVLEFGCGTGSTALLHAPYVKHIHAIDFSGKMIEIAIDKARDAGVENVSFARSAIEELAVPERTYDAVLALNVLHLVERPEDVLESVYSLLKPGGVFVSSTACIGDTMGFFRYIGPIGRRLGLLPQLSIFRRQELLDSLVKTGFVVEREWQPDPAKALFLVAKKNGDSGLENSGSSSND